jgi:hypothetical protein
MKLSKKNLVDHLDGTKAPDEADARSAQWKVDDVKAFAIVAMSLSPNFQTMVRSSPNAAHAWMVLNQFFVRRNTHNRVQLRRKLHEFKMQRGSNVIDHMMRFDELCLSMSAIGDDVLPDEQLVLLLGSLSSEYGPIVRSLRTWLVLTCFRSKRCCVASTRACRRTTAVKSH